MSSPIKVVPNSFVQLFIVDCASMFSNSQLNFPFSFTNILDTTFLAGNAINNIMGFTCGSSIDNDRCFRVKSFFISQNFSDHFRMFQIILEYFRSFQNVPDHFRMFQIILKCYRLLQNVLDYSRMFLIILKYSRLFQNVPKVNTEK